MSINKKLSLLMLILLPINMLCNTTTYESTSIKKSRIIHNLLEKIKAPRPDIQEGTVVPSPSTINATYLLALVNTAISATSTATRNNVPNTIVKRDGSGNFATNMVTLDGTPTNATDATTKGYVDTLVGSGGIVAKDPARVVSTGNVPLNGLQNIDGVTLIANDRVLLVGQTDPIENGLWLAQVAAWTRPADFANGTEAGAAYVLISEGATEIGTSWLCNTPTARIDADDIYFAQFSAPGQTTATNLGTGAGKVFKNKTGITLNLRSIAAGNHISVDNNSEDITIGINASTTHPNTIVLRDTSGNFAAGTITANLAGNAATSTSFSGPLVGDVTGTQGATVVSTVGGQTAANVASATVDVGNATNLNTADTLVKRNGSGDFSAETITAALSGNATTATTSTNFSGPLVGDVTGTQPATVVTLVGGESAVDVAAATIDVGNATDANTANTLVQRDSSGDFAANIITADLVGNATTATSAGSFSGALVGDVTGTQGATVVSLVGGQTAANVAAATVDVGNATSLNTANTLVERDASGNFSAGTITANLSGNATTATSTTNFSGALVGDVTGTQGATVVSNVGGQTAANVASATADVGNATNLNTANTLVKRDASGNFAAGTITASLTGNATTATTATTATSFSGALVGDVTGTQGATVVSAVGGQTAANVALATIAANAATDANTANAIVKRDASGNFTTNKITISGTVTNGTDAATKDYVDTAASTGLDPKDPARVVSTTDTANSGLYTIDGVALSDSDRVLLVGQSSPNPETENGLWLAHSGAWTRPTDFATGTTAGAAYVLITEGASQAGSSWLCNTTTAVIDTTDIGFAQFSTPGQTTGANVGTGAGQVFRDKTGVTLNFKTIKAGSHVGVTNNADDITLATDATSANTASATVARDASGNFTAGTITASLAGNATTATSATSFSGALVGDVTGNQGATVVSAVGGQTAANVAAGSVLANAATDANTANTIVRRNASGNFSAGTITASLSGNATTATTAGSFSGPLVGDVTGNQGATVVSAVGGQTAANVASGSVLANAATDANTANRIVKRDASGNFSAGTITASLSGNATTATTATNFSGALAGEVTGNQGTTVVTNAVSTNTADRIVRRDGSGNFAAGTINANLTGSVTGAASLNVLKTGDTMTGALILPNGAEATPSLRFADADTGLFSDGTNVKVSVNGSEQLNVGTAAIACTVPIRHAAGTEALPSITFDGDTNTGIYHPAADTISFVTAANDRMGISSAGAVSINAFGTAGVVHNNASGVLSSSVITNADITDNTISGTKLTDNTVADSKLQPITTAGKVANSATTATTANTLNTIVLRDGSDGGFNAGTITIDTDGVLELDNGTEALPSLTFTGDTNRNSGMYHPANNTVVFVIGGSEKLRLDTTAITSAEPILHPVGDATKPSITFTGDTDTGISAATANTLAFSTDGVQRLAIATGNITSTLPIRHPAGTAAAPSITFDGDANTGISAATTDRLSLSTAATERMSIDSTSVTTTVPVELPNGSAAAPSLKFADADTGLFSSGTNVKVSVNGTEKLNVGTLAIVSAVPIRNAVGSAGSPSMTFDGDTNTGISAATADTLVFSTSGTERMSISTAAITTAIRLIRNHVLCDQATQVATVSTGGSVTVNNDTSILLLTAASGAYTNYTITLPSSPVAGQILTILLIKNISVGINYSVPVGTMIFPVNTLDGSTTPTATAYGSSVSYLYDSGTGNWIRYNRG